jgi:orotate phosphoribosyltransferase-like protein
MINAQAELSARGMTQLRISQNLQIDRQMAKHLRLLQGDGRRSGA